LLSNAAKDHFIRYKERIRLRPRVLVDVSSVDIRTTVLGTPVSMPILVAPTGFHGLAHPEGECITAQAAGETGTLIGVSTFAPRSLEEIARVASGPLWFQLYMYRNMNIPCSENTSMMPGGATSILCLFVTIQES
jgi:4-hydroxymandelate oxidase